MATRDVYLHTSPNAGSVFAFGTLTERGTIIVYEGACARYDEVPSVPPWTQKLRHDLMIEGIWVPVRRACYRQVRDYEYKSLSSASNALMGSMTRGPMAWRCVSHNKPLNKCSKC